MPDYNKMWEEYKNSVINRVSNPGQTLATALQEGMPSEENPVGMFGIGSIGKAGKATKEVMSDANMFKYLNRHKSRAEQILPDNTKVYQMKRGEWANEEGQVIFKDTQHMLDSLRDYHMAQEAKLNNIIPNKEMMPNVQRSTSPFYKDPFKDTTQ